jgi:hypothetical protein
MLVVALGLLQGAACGVVDVRNVGSGRNTQGDPPRVPLDGADVCAPDPSLEEARKAKTGDVKACDAAYSFARRCSANHPEAVAVESEVCASFLEVQTNAAVEKLKKSIKRSDVGADTPTEFWPRLNMSGALAGYFQPSGPSFDGLRLFGVALARLDDLKPTDARSVAILGDARKLRADTIKFEQDVSALAPSPSCDAISSFETGATRVGDVTADRYRRVGRSRRDEQVGLHRQEIQKRTTKPLRLAEANLDDVRKLIAETRPLPAGITCFDPDAAKVTAGEVQAWATSLESQIAAEEKCRATPACMGARIAEQLCPILDERRETAAAISTERSNPAGVVNLATLHDLGQKLQYEDAMIARLKSEYATAAKRPFTTGACSR